MFRQSSKGGQMARAAFPATVVNLMLSDVVGDKMDVIASGPFVPDNSTFKDVEKIFRKYYAPIGGTVMVTAANIIGNSEKIVRAKPELADAVTKEILKVEKSSYLNKGDPSPECRNVAIGQAIDAFDQFYDLVGPKTKVMNFVKRQLTNTRKQVAGKAERFIKKHA